MSVRKRNNKWWVDFRFNRQRYRKPSPENSKKGALAYELTLRQKLTRGEEILNPHESESDEDKQITFKEYAEKWFAIYVQNNNKFAEVSNKQYILNSHLIPHFGQKLICEISNYDIEEYKTRKLKSGLSPKTVNNHLIVLSRCLNTALEWNIIENVPKIKRLKVAPQKYDFLNEVESRQILENTSGTLHDMILVALKTGVRFGELIALEWSDIDFQEKVLIVRQAIVRGRLGSTKSNKIRHIPLTEEVCQILLAKAKKRGFVFTDGNNKPLKHRHYLRLLKKACEKAGLREIGWHVLRHTFASHLAGNNAPMKAIQEMLGHSDIVTTMRYSHVSHSTLRDAVKTLEGKHIGHNMVTGLLNNSQ